MANLSNFGIPGGGNGIFAPRLSHRWRVTFQNIGRLVSGVNSRDLTMQAIQVERPNIEWDEAEQHRYNSTAYVATKHHFNEMPMTVEDDITGLASAVITAQLETQQRLIGVDLDGRWLNAAATGSDYKFGLILELLDGDEGVVETWYIEGAWIKSAQFGEMSYDNSEVMKIQMSIRYDHAHKVDNGKGYGTSLGGALTQ
jgi:hypothetical protein